MKERPKVGDRVEFIARRIKRTGTVVAVAETGAHFLVETPFPQNALIHPWEIERNCRERRISINAIIRILPKEECIDQIQGKHRED